jgi:hypothetical protein
LSRTVAAQELTPEYCEGVWKIAKVASDGTVNANPQPGLVIFSRGYFTIVRVTSAEPCRQAPQVGGPAQLTDAVKIARHDEWLPFGASAGTYEVKGQMLITHNIVAKNVGGMNITEESTVRVIDRDTFSASAGPGQPTAGRETTYVRVR